MIKLLLPLISLAWPLHLHAQVDLVAIHGKVWTENPKQPEAEAIAVSGHRILAVGTTDEIEQACRPADRGAGSGTPRRPRFQRCACALLLGRSGTASVQLRDVTSRQQFTQRIADYARTRAAGEWIVDGNWDEEKWTPGRASYP